MFKLSSIIMMFFFVLTFDMYPSTALQCGKCTTQTEMKKVIDQNGKDLSVSYLYGDCSSNEIEITILSVDGGIGTTEEKIKYGIRGVILNVLKEKNCSELNITVYLPACWNGETAVNCDQTNKCCSVSYKVKCNSTQDDIEIIETVSINQESCSCSGYLNYCTALDLANAGGCSDECYWTLNGNMNVNENNFIGPTNGADFIIKTLDPIDSQLKKRMIVRSDGKVFIGKTLDNGNYIQDGLLDLNFGKWGSWPKISFSQGMNEEPSLRFYAPTGIFCLDNGDVHSFNWRIQLSKRSENLGSLDFMTSGSPCLISDLVPQVKMTILQNGNVGIGLSNPEQRLQISGNMFVKGEAISSYDKSKPALRIERQDCNELYELISAGDKYTKTFTVLSNGSVGIGLSNPEQKLQISGNLFVKGEATSLYDKTMPALRIERQDCDELYELISAGDKYTKTFTVLSNGSVGIGLSNPEQKLQISGNMFVKGEATSLYDKTKPALRIERQDCNELYELISAGDKYTKTFTVLSNGSVCIGDMTNVDPQKKETLTLDGTARIFGKVAIGNGSFVQTGFGDIKLTVDGTIVSKESVVILDYWADHVFKPGYLLMTLEEVEKRIKMNGHLPGIPSEKEVKENGVKVGEMQAKLLQKIEEMTLYMIEMKKENENLKKRIELLESK